MQKDVIFKIILGIFTFIISPITLWISILTSDESAVFASLSRMIWYTGSSLQIFLAMIVLFIPMLISFYYACYIQNIKRYKKIICTVLLSVGTIILYIGAMWIMPGDGGTLTKENIWHGILSFGGIFLIFLTLCLYAGFIYKIDKKSSCIIGLFLIFLLITELFAVFNVSDERSYVLASAIAEMYVLTMLSIISYLMLYFTSFKKGGNEDDNRN